MPCPCHAPTMSFLSRTQHSTAVFCSGLEKNGIVRVWNGHGMASVNQTRLHCVNQMGKTHSKSLVARHVHGMPCVNRPLWCVMHTHISFSQYKARFNSSYDAPKLTFPPDCLLFCAPEPRHSCTRRF